MISRLFLTLALASSLSLAAASEAEKGYRLGVVTGVTFTAGLIALASGFYTNSPDTKSAGIGILTGLMCARLEHYAQKLLSDNLLPLAPISWGAERSMRSQALIDNGIALSKPGSRNTLHATNAANAARAASWISYLTYHGARYAIE